MVTDNVCSSEKAVTGVIQHVICAERGTFDLGCRLGLFMQFGMHTAGWGCHPKEYERKKCDVLKQFSNSSRGKQPD